MAKQFFYNNIIMETTQQQKRDCPKQYFFEQIQKVIYSGLPAKERLDLIEHLAKSMDNEKCNCGTHLTFSRL